MGAFGLPKPKAEARYSDAKGGNMESEVHQVLGDIKIQEICERYGLDNFAKYIIDIILVKWDDLVGNKKEKIKVFEEEAGWYPEKEKLARALRGICQLFATTKTGYYLWSALVNFNPVNLSR